jgi:hypothetical protein
MPTASCKHSLDILVGRHLAAYRNRRSKKFARHPTGRDREHNRLDMQSRHAFGRIHGLPHRPFRLAKIYDSASLDAAGPGMPDAKNLNTMGAARQHLSGRAGLESRDHASNLAGANIESTNHGRPTP